MWSEDIEPLLETDVDRILTAPTVLEWLNGRHPGRFGRSHLYYSEEQGCEAENPKYEFPEGVAHGFILADGGRDNARRRDGFVFRPTITYASSSVLTGLIVLSGTKLIS